MSGYSLPDYDSWLFRQAEEHMSQEEFDDEVCNECGMIDCECTYCPDCKTVNGCSCDEQYEQWKDSQL